MHLSEAQKLIYNFLGNTHPKASQAYLGALEVLDHDCKDRMNQSANSIRHALGLITRNIKLEKDPKDEKSHKKKLKKIIDPLGRSTSDLDHVLNLLIDKYHKWFTAVAHYEKFPSEREYRRKFSEMEGILLKIARPHFDVIGEIDKILANEKPSLSSLKKLSEFIVRQSSYDYFFQNASDDWLPFLIKKGYFENPKHLIKEGNLIMYNFVEPSRYLARSAKKRPGEVLKIILKHKVPVKEERNPIILEHFVIATTNMSSRQARKIVNKMYEEKWLEVIYFSRLNEVISDLMVKISNDGYREDAIKLARTLFDVTHGEPRPIANMLEEYIMVKDVRPVMDHDWYTHLAKERLPVLARNNPESLVDLLAFLLNKSIFLENAGRNNRESKSDSSTSWRPAIEVHEQNHDRDFRSTLVDLLCTVLESEGSTNPRRLKKELEAIKQKQYPLFRRLELYIYRKYPKQFKPEIEEVVIQYFGRKETWHEYYHLLKDVFPLVSGNVKKSFFDKVKNGPPKKLVDGWKENEVANPGIVEYRRKYWAMTQLSPVSEFLEGDIKKQYDEIVQEIGSPDIPDFNGYHSTMAAVKPTTELNDGLSIDEVITFVKNHETKENTAFSFFDGTWMKFQEYVEKNPLEYSKKVSELKSSDPSILHALFLGLENALKKNHQVDWEDLLSLCSSILESVRNKTYKETHEFDVLNSIASLLDTGLQKEKLSPSFAYRDEIWKILCSLIELGSAAKSWEENYPDKNWDSMGISINTTTGETFHAISKYALWCHHNLKKENSGPQFAPEVKKLLDEYFEQTIPNTISRHAVLGIQFPNLVFFDHDWAIKNLDKIFPDTNPKLKRASWDAYLHNGVLGWIFKELYKQYSDHIEDLKNLKLVDGRLDHYDERLIDHITTAYLYNLEKAESLFQDLMNLENVQVLAHCAWQVGLVLKLYQDSPNKSLDLEAVRKIWQSKLVAYGETGWWFVRSPFSKEETIDLLLDSLKRTSVVINFIYTVEKELVDYAKELPLKTVEVLELILKSEKNKSELYAVRGDTTQNILKTLLESKNKRAILKTKNLINYLGELGFNEYKDLLKDNKESLDGKKGTN